MRIQHLEDGLHGGGGPSLEQQQLLALEMHLSIPSSSRPLPLQVGQDCCQFSSKASAVLHCVAVL